MCEKLILSNPIEEALMVEEPIMYLTWKVVASETVVYTLLDGAFKNRAGIANLCIESL